MEGLKERVKSAKRIVVKIGTFVISKKDGGIDNEYIAEIAGQISEFRGKEFILITSGAIGKGIRELGLGSFPRDVKLRQACAAVGQTLLMNAYHEAFRKHGLKVGQILLTYEDFKNRASYINMMNTFEKLIRLGVIPIVNENDSISLSEIGKGFGDNDRLSALVASRVNADLLIMLSSAEGLYENVPKKGEGGKIIEVVEAVTPEIKAMCGKAGIFGLGGMKSKVEAAEIVTDSGIPVVLTYGKGKNVISNVLNADYHGTTFLPKRRLSNKKFWIKITPAKGRIIVDEGANKALRNGKNLLPAGIVDVEGAFASGDVVDIVVGDRIVAKVISNFSSKDIKRAMGKRSSEVRQVLGNRDVTNRENLVII